MLSLGAKGPRLNCSRQFCTVLHFLIIRICIYPYNSGQKRNLLKKDKYVCEIGQHSTSILFRKKALPIIESAHVPKWSSSQNGFLFVKGLFLCFSPFFFFWSTLSIQLFVCLFVNVFIFLIKSMERNVDWTENVSFSRPKCNLKTTGRDIRIESVMAFSQVIAWGGLVLVLGSFTLSVSSDASIEVLVLSALSLIL